MCHTRAELAALGHGPKLVLATLGTLEAGASRQLLVEWAANPANLVLFPGRAPARAPRRAATLPLVLFIPPAAGSVGCHLGQSRALRASIRACHGPIYSLLIVIFALAAAYAAANMASFVLILQGARRFTALARQQGLVRDYEGVDYFHCPG